jgi:hypothetical protein
MDEEVNLRMPSAVEMLTSSDLEQYPDFWPPNLFLNSQVVFQFHEVSKSG